MSIIMLAALVAGGAGAFLVAKATQYATQSPASAPAANPIAAARVVPASESPPAASPSAAISPTPAVPAPALPVPAPAGAAPVTTASVPTTAAPPHTATPDPAPAMTRPPEAALLAAVGPPRPTDKASKPHPHPAHAIAAARPRDSEPPAEPTRAEPRTDDRPAEPARSEVKAEAPPLEPPAVKPPEREPEPAPAARQEPPAPRPGTIDVAATRAAARAQIGPVQQCYERARMDDSSLAGTVMARLTIAADGSVAGVEIVKSTLGAPQVETCIRQGILRWHLPRPSGGAAASLTYPLVFQ